jgi:hypothetical protein
MSHNRPPVRVYVTLATRSTLRQPTPLATPPAASAPAPDGSPAILQPL